VAEAAARRPRIGAKTALEGLRETCRSGLVHGVRVRPPERLRLSEDLCAAADGIDRDRRHAVLEGQHEAVQPSRHHDVDSGDQGLHLGGRSQARRVPVQPGVDGHDRDLARCDERAQQIVGGFVRAALPVAGAVVMTR
jgi:hypothetical protein